MAHQLDIRSDEAVSLAKNLSRRLGRPVADIVLTALREFGAKQVAVDGLTPTQRTEFEALRAPGRGNREAQAAGRDFRSPRYV